MWISHCFCYKSCILRDLIVNHISPMVWVTFQSKHEHVWKTYALHQKSKHHWPDCFCLDSSSSINLPHISGHRGDLLNPEADDRILLRLLLQLCPILLYITILSSFWELSAFTLERKMQRFQLACCSELFGINTVFVQRLIVGVVQVTWKLLPIN